MSRPEATDQTSNSPSLPEASGQTNSQPNLPAPRVRKYEYIYVDNTKNPPRKITLIVNLDYQYSYDDILAIWPGRLNLLLEWLRSENIVLAPIFIPSYEISSEANSGKPGSLSHYVRANKKEWAEKTDVTDKTRLIFIPYNTGGHWVILLLYFQADNTLDLNRLAYMDSLIHQTGTLSVENSSVATELMQACPEFTMTDQVPILVRYMQTDSIVCGPLAIENAMELIKWVYLNRELVPVLCSIEKTAQSRFGTVQFRGVQLRHSGGAESPVYQRQLENRITVMNAPERWEMMTKLQSERTLGEQGQLIRDLMSKLNDDFRKQLKEALTVREEEEPRSHLTRIRTAFKDIYDQLNQRKEEQRKLYNSISEAFQNGDEEEDSALDEAKSDLEKTQQEFATFKLLLEQVFALDNIPETFDSNVIMSLPFRDEMREYDALCKLGKEILGPSSFSSLPDFLPPGFAALEDISLGLYRGGKTQDSDAPGGGGYGTFGNFPLFGDIGVRLGLESKVGEEKTEGKEKKSAEKKSDDDDLYPNPFTDDNGDDDGPSSSLFDFSS